MEVTIKDVARKAGVSITTVSRVINDKPDVSDNTKEKVKEVITRLGYNPNTIARGLVLNKTYTIGLLIPNISNPFFPQLARGVENKAKELGYSVILYDTDNHKEEEKKAIDILTRKRVDGIILSLSINNRDELNKLQQRDFPVVQIDRNIPGSRYPAVTIDNIASSYKATRYLIQLGHTKIAHVTGDLDTRTGQERLMGYKKALSEFNLYEREDWIVEGDFSLQSGFEGMKELLSFPEQPTAVFFSNDLMAIGAYEAVFNQNLEIPGDVSIIGHDDIEVSSIIRPKLTTITQPKYQLGEIAAETLIKKIEGRSLDEFRDHIMEARLSVRYSTGTPS